MKAIHWLETKRKRINIDFERVSIVCALMRGSQKQKTFRFAQVASLRDSCDIGFSHEIKRGIHFQIEKRKIIAVVCVPHITQSFVISRCFAVDDKEMYKD